MTVASNRSESSGGRASIESGLANSELGVGRQSLVLRSEIFENGDTLPTRATIDGDGTPPLIFWDPPHSGVHSFALICEDPDAPQPKPFVHWLVYAIPGHTSSLDSNLVAFREGRNSRGEEGYAPAAPPHGDGPHHYHFQLFALDSEVMLPEDADRDELVQAMRGHVVAWGELVGTYERC